MYSEIQKLYGNKANEFIIFFYQGERASLTVFRQKKKIRELKH